MAHVRAHRVLPGFGLSLGFTLAYLSLIVLVPIGARIRSPESSMAL
mgnify:CR=1 FL=1